MTVFGDPTELRAALDEVLAPSEVIELVGPAVGSTFVLTDQRLLLVRQGSSFRPRSGVRWWPVDGDLILRLGRPSRGSSQLIIARSGRSVSVFLTEDHLKAVTAMIAEIRRRAYSDDQVD